MSAPAAAARCFCCCPYRSSARLCIVGVKLVPKEMHAVKTAKSAPELVLNVSA